MCVCVCVCVRVWSCRKLPLGVHLNGDESMALGASFLAANRSKAFSVRKVGMVDTFPFAIGVRLAELPGYVDTSVDEEGNPVKRACCACAGRLGVVMCVSGR